MQHDSTWRSHQLHGMGGHTTTRIFFAFFLPCDETKAVIIKTNRCRNVVVLDIRIARDRSRGRGRCLEGTLLVWSNNHHFLAVAVVFLLFDSG
jgi:hypothetical protein